MTHHGEEFEGPEVTIRV